MKTKNNTRRTFRALEAFKTVLLTGLLVSLVLLVIVYIGGMRVYENAVSDGDLGESFDRLWSVLGGAEPEGLDASRLQPELIGYKQSSSLTPLAVTADKAGIAELYELATPCILELFGSDSVCTRLTADEGRHRFAAAQASEEFVYLRYHTPVLYQFIYAYAAGELTVSESDVAVGTNGSVGAYVSELIIVPDKDFAAHRFVALATDSDGGYFEFRPSDHIVTSSFYISKLADSGSDIDTVPFTFAEHPRFDSSEPIIDGELEYTEILTEAVPLGDDTIREGLLRLFEYNPDKLNGYTDGDGYVYVDSHSQLRLEGGMVSFLTTDQTSTNNTLRGIRIDSLLGYTSSDTSGLFDKLTAVDNLIRSLGEISPLLIGGEASLCLGDVYSDGALLIIEYFLTYNGIRIEGDPYLRTVLTEETVCEVTLHPYSVRSKDISVLSPSPRYILRGLETLGELPEGTAIDSVRMRYGSDGAAWCVILSK